MKRAITVTVNGDVYQKEVETHWALVDFIRDELDLTGTKKACETGDCGACSVLLDGKLVCSCLVLAVEVDGSSISTIEDVARGNELHPVQEAFVQHGGFQCGYCTPGMVLAAKTLLEESPQPDDEEIRQAMRGNLCRCTGYVKIMESVRAAARAMSAAGGRA